MKPILLIFPAFMLLSPFALSQHVLRMQTRPLGNVPEKQGSVWNRLSGR